MATISETYVENRERVQPNDTNNYGAVHGGNVMYWLDEVGAICAMRHAGETCVTAHVDDLDFKRPVPQGETCALVGYAYDTGRTSIRVRLRAFHEDPLTGEREQTTEARFVFVAIDDSGDTTPVPDLTVESDRCRELRDAAFEGDNGK
jgi:acyl-CoA hydrolase